MKKSICIETMFLDKEFEERFRLARQFGFEYVEFWTWTDKNIKMVKELCSYYNLKIASLSGDEKFSMINEDESDEYIDFAIQSINTAIDLNCRHVVLHSNALAKNGQVINSFDDIPYDKKFASMVRVLKILSSIAEEKNVNLVLEPLNSFIDHHGNFLKSTADAVAIVDSVGSFNVKVLYDIYHMQIMEGNIINSIEKYFNHIGYIHVADVPGRHEPGTGEINFVNVFNRLRVLNYQGIIGFELFPSQKNEEIMSILLNL